MGYSDSDSTCQEFYYMYDSDGEVTGEVCVYSESVAAA